MSSLFFKRRKKAEAGGKNAHRTEKSKKRVAFFIKMVYNAENEHLCDLEDRPYGGKE